MIEGKATVTGTARDFKTNKVIISFMFEDFPKEADLTGDLRVTVRRWREKRSLDANAYYWSINSQMARALDTSPEELHEELLQRYGLIDSDDDGYITITVKSKVDMSRIDGHWKLYKLSEDGKWKSYLRIRGTSEYDTAEMSYFLDRVIEEAKELGINTETPDQRAEAERWLKRA